MSTPTTRLPTLLGAVTLTALALVLMLWQQVDAEACFQGSAAVTCEPPASAGTDER